MFTELLHRKSEPEFYAFRLAIFCAMNSTIPRSPASMRLNRRRNLASMRASLRTLMCSLNESTDVRHNVGGVRQYDVVSVASDDKQSRIRDLLLVTIGFRHRYHCVSIACDHQCGGGNLR